MQRNRELGNILFHNLSASEFFSWLLLVLNRLQMRLKQKKKPQVPRLFKLCLSPSFKLEKRMKQLFFAKVYFGAGQIFVAGGANRKKPGHISV